MCPEGLRFLAGGFVTKGIIEKSVSAFSWGVFCQSELGI